MKQKQKQSDSYMICICKEMAVEWHDHGVMGMIKNEKYKGDVLLGKTFPLLNQKK